jgi:hypothetical protein
LESCLSLRVYKYVHKHVKLSCVKLIKEYALTLYGGMKICPCILCLEISRQIHAPATLPYGKEPSLPIGVYVCMYVYMYVCMYVCVYMYVCVCVCMYVCMYVYCKDFF